MKTQLTDEQESAIDDLKWQSDESLQDDIDSLKREFKDEVDELREEMNDDIKELRKDSRSELKVEIRELKESWKQEDLSA